MERLGAIGPIGKLAVPAFSLKKLNELIDRSSASAQLLALERGHLRRCGINVVYRRYVRFGFRRTLDNQVSGAPK
jgi:hypothetical protein